MEEICRLCCSTKFVNNYIFDEENALYLKMSLYLPIKVFKNDRLPQKVCDRCSCKVNDFYQFCNETIEVQNRLRAVLISSAVANIEIEDSVDLTHIKQDAHSPSLPEFTDQKVDLKLEQHRYRSTQGLNADLSRKFDSLDARLDIQQERRTCNQMTQTEDIRESNAVTIEIVKQEPTQPSQELVKSEVDVYLDDNCFGTNQSDNSEDDMSLIQFQKKKKSKKAKVSNGGIDKRKRKKELKEWDMLMQALPASTAVTVVNEQADVKVKQEAPDMNVQVSAGGGAVKAEPGAFHCCVCFHQCCSRTEIMKHYKQHASEMEPCSPPAAPPPPPGGEHVKCTRCQKRLERSMWASHWSRHWERDRRPLRCALCEKTFRDHHQIFKHGLTHKMGEGGEPTTTAPESGLEKRFVCDVCPESFVYMRYLLSHRARAHPEAAARALALRCASCGRQFAHLNSLRRHLRAHTGERNFLCNICGKALSSREHLKFHIRIHTGYKPNVCKTCGKGFVKKCNLTLHERVHSGERPHVCPACGKAFSQRSTLVIHERYHSGARPYVCGLCQRGFVAKGLLSMHLKTTCI